MIKTVKFEKDRTFLIDGVLNKSIDDILNDKNIFTVLYQSVRSMNTVKQMIIRALQDDDKIIGNERIEIIQSIDQYLYSCFIIAFLFSDNPALFHREINGVFHIFLSNDHTKYLTGKGQILMLPKIEGDYDSWYNRKVIESFKEVISLTSDRQKHQEMLKKLVDLIYLLISLRYKFEYINT